MKEIAFFDFDGTISHKDSMIEFMKKYIGVYSFYKALIVLSPVLLAYKLRMISNHKAKEKLINYLFKGWSFLNFKRIAENYSNNEIYNIVRPSAIERIKLHQKKGHKVVIVSASVENWLEGWCENNNIELIATKLQVLDGKITGKYLTKNCYGQEKVNRIKKLFNIDNYSEIHVYGDSRGDKEMLNIATKKYYKPFR